jgi:hypothetical protein
VLVAASWLLGAGLRPTVARAQVISAMNTWHVDQLPPDQLDPQLAAMSSNGVTLVREDAPWDWRPSPRPGSARFNSHSRGRDERCCRTGVTSS